MIPGPRPGSIVALNEKLIRIAQEQRGTLLVKIEYGTLLGLIPRESDRKELTRLGKEFYESGNTLGVAAPNERAATESRRADLLDQILQKIQWHFRAMRRPMPTREEVAEMLKDHFQ